ncbi:MAG TPA: ABC transporter permease [Actinomycetota bacterium]|nr:ABC transporter permease [Actinomycetota bacterium]
MSAVATGVVGTTSVRRARVLGAVFILAGVAIALFFGAGADAGTDSTLVLDAPRADTFFAVPNLVLPTAGTAYVLSAVCLALGGWQLAKGFERRANLVLSIVALLFVFTFLIWAAEGRSLSLVGMLQSTVLRSVPIAFGALAGVLCERAGVVNIAIEGMLLSAAFTSAVAASMTDSLWLGLLIGAVTGAVVAWILAVLSIRYLVDQIVAGTVINIFALGITSYLSSRFLQSNPDLNNPGRFQNVEIPLLADIPVIGPVLFNHNVFVYLLFITVAVTFVGLFHTAWGLRVRAVGEHPKAADTVGIRVLFTRYRNVMLGGLVAGIGGAYFTLGAVGRFEEGMTAGRGFIGLAAMIFGRWNPVGAFAAALIFGFADSLQVKLNILQVGIPSEFLGMAPYLVTILIVAGAAHRVRPPAADGKPYVKE